MTITHAIQLRREVGFARPKPLPPEIWGDSVSLKFNPLMSFLLKWISCSFFDSLT